MSVSPGFISQEQLGFRDYISKVYGWMGIGLGITAVVAFLVSTSPGLVRAIYVNSLVFFGLVIIGLIMVWYLAANVQRMSPETARITFILYSALNGLVLSVIFLAYTAVSIVSTFIATASMFAIMSIYGYITKRDLTNMGSLLFMALIGFIIASIINIFFYNQTVYWVITFLGIIIFIALTAYDTQRIKNLAAMRAVTLEDLNKLAIVGALALYLDFINLFLLLLRFNRQK